MDDMNDYPPIFYHFLLCLSGCLNSSGCLLVCCALHVSLRGKLVALGCRPVWSLDRGARHSYTSRAGRNAAETHRCTGCFEDGPRIVHQSSSTLMIIIVMMIMVIVVVVIIIIITTSPPDCLFFWNLRKRIYWSSGIIFKHHVFQVAGQTINQPNAVDVQI